MSVTDDSIIYEAVFELGGSTYRLVQLRSEKPEPCDYVMYKDGEEIAIQNVTMLRDGGTVRGRFAPDPDQEPPPPPRTMTKTDDDGKVTTTRLFTFRANPLEFYIPERWFANDAQPTIGGVRGTLISWRLADRAWGNS